MPCILTVFGITMGGGGEILYLKRQSRVIERSSFVISLSYVCIICICYCAVPQKRLELYPRPIWTDPPTIITTRTECCCVYVIFYFSHWQRINIKNINLKSYSSAGNHILCFFIFSSKQNLFGKC